MKKVLTIVFSLFLIGCRWCCWCNCNKPKPNASECYKAKKYRQKEEETTLPIVDPRHVTLRIATITDTHPAEYTPSPNTPKFRKQVGELREQIANATTLFEILHLKSVANQRSPKLFALAWTKEKEIRTKVAEGRI
jgi:hypothetical protein